METLREKVTEIILLTRQDAAMNSGKGGGSSGIAIDAVLALILEDRKVFLKKLLKRVPEEDLKNMI